MKQLIVVFSFFTFISTSFGYAQEVACTHTVSGTILDIETKKPIPYVTVKVRGTEKFTITNIDGEFLIEELCTDKNTLIISCFGYCNSVCEHNHQHGKSPHIFLTQDVLGLDTVTINALRRKEGGTESISQVHLKKSEIRFSPTKSLANVISEQQGVTFASTGNNVQLPVIHGLYGNRILILNNGLKHGFQNWGTDHAPEIDISSANAITIVKGAAGVRFGPEALGGAIIVESNPMYLKEPLYAEIGTSFQTNGKGVSTNFELGNGFEKWSYFFNGNSTKIGDRNTPNYNLKNSGKEEKSFGSGIRYHFENFDFKIYYSYVDQNLALLRSSVAESGNAFVKAINSDRPAFTDTFSYGIGEPNQLTKHHLVKAEVNWWYSDEGKLTFTGGRQLNKREEYDVRRNADKPIMDLDLITYDYQLEWKHPDWFKLDGLLGVQFFSQDNDNNPGTDFSLFIPNYNTNRFSVFLIESRKTEKNTFEFGLRFDHETNDIRGRETNTAIFRDNYSFTNVTASFGYVREISEKSTFRTNIGTAWRTPNMSELYSFGQHGFKTSFGLLRYYKNDDNVFKTDRVLNSNDSDVQPERGYKFINEFQTRQHNNTHTATFYTHYIQNYIFDRPIGVRGTFTGPMPVFVFDQTDAAFAGVDYTWKKTWNNEYSGNFGLSYLWSKNLSENQALINQPPISISYGLEWNQVNFWKFNSSKLLVKPNYTFQQFNAPRTVLAEDLIDGSVAIDPEAEIFDFKDAPKGYFLLDLVWSFKMKNLSGTISVNNLLNTSYRNYLNEMRYFADEPGRNIQFSLNYKFNK
jgi:iron complex outermembrane receptor protein